MSSRPVIVFLCFVFWLIPSALGETLEPASYAVALDPDAQTLSVAVEVPLTDADEVKVRLPSGLTIIEATIDGAPVDVAGAGTQAVITIPSNSGAHPLRVVYGNGVRSGVADSGVAWAPAAFSSDGSFIEANDWFARFGPMPNRYRLTIDVPSGQAAVATAALVEEHVGDSGFRAVFEGELADGAPALFAGPYELAERRHGAILLRTYFHEEAAPLAPSYFDQAAEYLDTYEDLIGPYPHDHFYMVSATLPVGLGFPGLTYFSRRILPMPFMRTRSLAHEILHNWWGNGVRPDYESGNWSEGLTTYMADYRLAETESPVAARDMRFGWLRDFAALPAERDLPVTSFTVREHTAAQVIGYNKVAAIFHMLKAEIGEPAFDAGGEALWRDYAGRTAGWGDFEAVFSSVADRDLSGFFDQWTKRRGAPAFALTETDAVQDGEGWRVDVTVVQAAPVYEVTLPLVIETDDGRHEVSVRMDGRRAQARFQVAAPPRAVTIDPDYHLFRRLAPGETPAIMRDVTLDEDSVLVVAGTTEEVATSAETLAARMLDSAASGPSRAASIAEAGDRPVLLIGLTDNVAELLGSGGLADIPGALKERGTARAWAARRSNRAPILIVAADNPDALAALQRPLPHYGSRSYVVFDSTNAIDKGLWSITQSHRLRRVIEE